MGPVGAVRRLESVLREAQFGEVAEELTDGVARGIARAVDRHMSRILARGVSHVDIGVGLQPREKGRNGRGKR